MSIAQAMANIALGFSSALGVGYHPAIARWPGTPVTDDGGSITAAGEPIEEECSVQVDSVTEAMRAAAGFTEKDMRLLVLAATLNAQLDTDATITVLAGPHAGAWKLASVDRDPAGCYWEARGRRA